MITYSDLTHEMDLAQRWTTVYLGERAVATLEKRGVYDYDCPTLMLFDTNGALIARTWIGWGNATIKRKVADYLNEQQTQQPDKSDEVVL